MRKSSKQSTEAKATLVVVPALDPKVVAERVARRNREIDLQRATDKYQKARNALLQDEPILLDMNNNKQRAGERLIYVATMLETVGRLFLAIAQEERNAKIK